MKNVFSKKIRGRTNGFTMVETIFYLTFLVILLSVVISLVISIARTYQIIQATKNLESSAVFSLERISRDIRNATSVNVAQSSLATSVGVLTLNTINATGSPQVVKIYLPNLNGQIKVDLNGTYFGPLTLNGVTVNKLEFRLATSTKSQAIKVVLGLSSVVGTASTSKNFYTTVVLRGSY